MENISRLHQEFQVSFLGGWFVLITSGVRADSLYSASSKQSSPRRWSFAFLKTEYYLLFTSILEIQHRQNPCCVNLLTEARRSVRAKENICRTVGPGQEMERLWVSLFFFFSFIFRCPKKSRHLSVYSRNDSFVFFLQGGMTLTYDPTTALQNGSVCLLRPVSYGPEESLINLSLSAGFTPLPIALPPIGWLDQPPCPHICIHLCPPIR